MNISTKTKSLKDDFAFAIENMCGGEMDLSVSAHDYKLESLLLKW